MNAFNQYEVWFVTGAQLLYGGDAVIAVDAHSNEMVNGLNESGKLPVKVVYKGTANSSKEVEAVFKAANNDEKCVGVITWMHTFSPAKMWIHGLQQLKKPLLHLHTQFNKEIPWDTMDMDFMNLNQSAHGDREHGFIAARMRLPRKIVAGYWEDADVQEKIGGWMRAAVGAAVSRELKVMRFGDNMRQVAVTEGDKVEVQMKLGWQGNTYAVGDLVDLLVALGGNDDDLGAARLALHKVRHRLVVGGTLGGHGDDREARVDQGNRAMLHLAGSICLGVQIADLLELERSLV